MATQRCLDRIARLEATLDKYEDAFDALAEGSIQSYTLDTGQSRNTVTQQNLTELRKAIDSLENRIVVLKQRCGVTRPVRVCPAGW